MITEVKAEELHGVSGLAQWYFYQCGLLGQFNADAFVESWERLIKAGCGFILKRVSDGNVIEAIGVVVYPDPHDGNPSASTMFWYVVEEGASLAGGLLYNAILERCKATGVKRLNITSLVNHRIYKVENFLLHAGFKPIEVHYVKEL